MRARYDDSWLASRAAATPQEETALPAWRWAYFRPEALVDRTLQLTLDGTVRTQDAPFLLRALLMGTHSRGAGPGRFFKANWGPKLSQDLPRPRASARLCEGRAGAG